jgi:CDP-diacylglycerol--glycerol-3-phosphate 3-phosphatidyltransferase
MQSGDHVHRDSTWTVPKVLTALRIVMAIVAGVCFAIEANERLAVILCVVAAFLDAFDGWYARTFSQCSKLGKHLDPLADKMLMAVVYMLIAFKMDSPAVWILVVLIAIRELGMTVFRVYSLRRHKKFIPANWLGKAKMIVQSTVGIAIIVYAYLWNGGFDFSPLIVIAPLVLMLFLSYYSAVIYITSWRRALPTSHNDEATDSGARYSGSRRMVVGK